jgi:hypothetical protein
MKGKLKRIKLRTLVRIRKVFKNYGQSLLDNAEYLGSSVPVKYWNRSFI